MSVIELLELEEPDLAATLRSSSSEDLRRVGLAVADHLLVEVGLVEHVPVASADPSRLRAAREEATSVYWELHGGDGGPPAPGCLEAFTRERALVAALAALGADPLEAAAEAVYEACFAVDDRADVHAIVAAVG